MNTSVLVEAKAQTIKVTDKDLIVTLMDSREIKVPLVWFPKLLHANQTQRKNFRLIGEGIGIHWPAIDEDLSISGILAVR